ncbi:MAG: hypothetical protein QXU67_04670 [Candidatus Bathyarchaeia archaeon]
MAVALHNLKHTINKSIIVGGKLAFDKDILDKTLGRRSTFGLII